MWISKTTIATFATLIGIGGAAANTVLAAEQCDAQTLAVTSVSSVSSTAAANTGDPVFGTPLAKARLETQRGGQDMIINDQKLKATVSENSASNLNTGTNIITEGAFAGANGLPMVIQNSGNNVSIQNTTILNLNMK